MLLEKLVDFLDNGDQAWNQSEENLTALPLKPGDSKQQQFIEVQFADQVARFYCRIYFPEEFRALRSAIYPYGEDRYNSTVCISWSLVHVVF